MTAMPDSAPSGPAPEPSGASPDDIREHLRRDHERCVVALVPVHSCPDRVQSLVDRPVRQAASPQLTHELQLLIAIQLADIHIAPDVQRIACGRSIRMSTRKRSCVLHIVGLQCAR